MKLHSLTQSYKFLGCNSQMLNTPRPPLFSVVLGHVKVNPWYFLSRSLLYPIFNWISNLRSQDATVLAFAQLLKCTSAQLKAFCYFHLCFLPNSINIVHFYIPQLYQIHLPRSSLLGLLLPYIISSQEHLDLQWRGQFILHPLKIGFTGSVGWGAGHVLGKNPSMFSSMHDKWKNRISGY